MALVAGTGHFGFSDAPFVMPATIPRFGGRIIYPRRGWGVITRTLRACPDQSGERRQTFPPATQIARADGDPPAP